MLGLSALTPEAVSGAVLQMVNHGISTGALFLMVGFLYERTHTRDLSAYGGVAKVAPAIAATFWWSRCRSIGLPGTNGFVGSSCVLIGTFASRTIGARRCGGRRHRRDPGRRSHALDVPARLLRPAAQGGRARHPRSDGSRVVHAGAESCSRSSAIVSCPAPPLGGEEPVDAFVQR